jgi:hypothetical protein
MDRQHLTECLPALRRPARTLGSGIGRRSPCFKNLRRGPLPHSRCAMDACAHLCVKILSGLWAAREDAGLFSLLRALPNRQLVRRSMRWSMRQRDDARSYSGPDQPDQEQRTAAMA